MPTTLEQIQYGFDRDSRRTWQKRPLSTTQDQAYQYDALSQVCGAARGSLNSNLTAISGIPSLEESWNYDPTGNWRGYNQSASGSVILDQNRVHDRGNRLTQLEDNPHNQVLDRAGRVRQTAPDAEGDWDGKLELTWDAWSRITSVKNNGEVVGDYAYDGSHRRVMREVGEATLHSYYNNQWRPVEERMDAQNTASMSYLWGSRHRDDLVRRDRAVGGTSLNETRYMLMDYFNPSAITNKEGEVTERYAFSAFGLRTILNPDYTVRSSSECRMEFSFQGQFVDVETGWLNYGFRYYLPEIGRWGCKDPIGFRGGINLYGMVGNGPINRTDLLGLLVVTYKEFAAESAPVVYDSSCGRSPGCTTYKGEVTCTCGDTKPCILKCTVKFDATIHINPDWTGLGQEPGRLGKSQPVQISMDEVYGHEQRHIQDRLAKVQEHVVTPLEGEKSEFGTKGNCESAASAYKITYNGLLDTYTTPSMVGGHDTDPNTIAPENNRPYPPLPGSTTSPPSVPYATVPNTD